MTLAANYSWKVHLSMTLTVTPVSTNTWNSQFSTLKHLMGLRFCLSSTTPTFSILQRDSVSLLSEGSSSQKVLTASLFTISLILQHYFSKIILVANVESLVLLVSHFLLSNHTSSSYWISILMSYFSTSAYVSAQEVIWYSGTYIQS